VGIEHKIRLRGGWECDTLDSPTASSFRLTLPTRWTTADRRRLRLTRRFHSPPLEAGSRAVLRLEHIPGILALELNGQPAVPVSPACSEYEIPLDASASRHRLMLVIETPEPSDGSGAALGWGHVSLVIRSEGPTDGIAEPDRPAGS
jgi:hypothetical protein